MRRSELFVLVLSVTMTAGVLIAVSYACPPPHPPAAGHATFF